MVAYSPQECSKSSFAFGKGNWDCDLIELRNSYVLDVLVKVLPEMIS